MVLVSPVHQSESVICIHDSSFLDFLPIHITTENWAEFPVLYNRFPLVIYFMHSINSVYQFSISQFIPTLLLSLLVSIHLFSVSYTCLKKERKKMKRERKGAERFGHPSVWEGNTHSEIAFSPHTEFGSRWERLSPP